MPSILTQFTRGGDSAYRALVNAAKRGEDDYVATYENCNRYRVYVKDGRVIVEKIG